MWKCVERYSHCCASNLVPVLTGCLCERLYVLLYTKFRIIVRP